LLTNFLRQVKVKDESISEWIKKIQALAFQFRKAALMDCSMEERAGILTAADRLRNICFVRGLYSDRIQTIVRIRNSDNFDEIAETDRKKKVLLFQNKTDTKRGKGFTLSAAVAEDLATLVANVTGR